MAPVKSNGKKRICKNRHNTRTGVKRTNRKSVYNVKVKCKSNSGLCRVPQCKKRGQFFKRLDKHLLRAHPEISENQHSSLPRVERKDATYMRYRVKEECGLCGKTLLLRPHLKTAHNLKTWDEYILKLKGKGGKKSQRKQGEEKQSVSWGLHSLLQAVKTTGMVQRESREANEGSSSSYEDKDTPPSPTKSVRVNFSEDEFLRFCVHNTNSYMVRATHQAMATKRKDPINVLHYLSKNKLSIENCKYIVDMNFIPKLYGYYRFASYYPYPKGKCISCSSHSCLCGKLARSFYSFCRRACSPLFNCTVCKEWGSGYHTCADFFECDFCRAAAKKWPPKVPFKC